MNIDAGRYTNGRIALVNLSSSIESMERRRVEGADFHDLVALSKLLFLRGDVLGRIADHDRAEAVAREAAEASPSIGDALLIRARLAERFHRFEEAHALLDKAIKAGNESPEVNATRASIFQATGKFREALAARTALMEGDRGIHTIGALAALLADIGRWVAAETLYAEALEADDSVSPMPCAQLLFEWGVGAMRRGYLDRAEEVFGLLESILPAHVPGRGHRAEVALARGQLDAAAALVEPLLALSDDPEYLAIHAEILAAQKNHADATREALRAAAAYDSLLARRPEAYADHAAAFFMGIGDRPLLALELASKNRALRDTPRSRRLVARAQQAAAERGHFARAWSLVCDSRQAVPC